MISVSVVKFRFSDDVKPLDSIVAEINSQQKFLLDVEVSPIPQEVATILAFNQGGILLACIKNKQDLADLMMFLKRDSRILSKLKWKCVVFEDYQPTMIKHALNPLGVTDIFPLSFNVPLVKQRLESILEMFIPQEENSQQSSAGSKESVSWIEPLNMEADFWLMEDLSQIRRVLNTWVVSIQGPSTQIGTWEKKAPGTWTFKINENEQDIFGVGGGQWMVEAVTIPKLDWDEKRWVIQGAEIQLYYKSGNKKDYKIFSQDGTIQIAKDSLHAQMKRDLIINSYSEKFIFKVKKKNVVDAEIEVETPVGNLLELELVPVDESVWRNLRLRPPVKNKGAKKTPLAKKRERLLAKRQKNLQRRLQKTQRSTQPLSASERRKKMNLRPKPIPHVQSSEELENLLEEMQESMSEPIATSGVEKATDPTLDALYKMALEEEAQQKTEAAIATHLKCLAMDELFYDSLEHLFFLYDSTRRYEEAYEIGCKIVFNFEINEKVSCRVIHLVFVLQTYEDIFPLSMRLLSIGEPEERLCQHIGSGLFLIGRNYLDQKEDIQGFACFDLIAQNNDILGTHIKYIVLALLEMDRFLEADIYMEFIENPTDRMVCSKASELGIITDVSEFIQDAKNVFFNFTDNALKKYILNKLQLLGFSEEDALQQLEG